MDAPRLFIKDPQDNLITVISEGYFDVKLTSYLTGAATTLSFSFVKDSESYEQIVTGCKVAFIYNEKDYWMNIVNVYQDEDIMTVTAWGVSLELSNETVAPYKATKPMSFEEYANLWNYEKTFEIGINEVSDKRITHEWENGDKTLGRLLSLAKVFDAEIEFVTYLDDFHNLDRLVMNVYRAHSETNQGMGLDSRQLVYRFGKDIDTITKEEDSSELYTCITPTGKDGINISSIEFEKFDAEGNLEFCTYKTAKPDFPDVRKIYAPLAKLRHPSYRGQTRDEWTNLNWETEYTTANDLSGNALAKIKEVSAPTFTWNINGVIEAGIGDVVTIEDDGYQPTLYLEARVSEQTIDFSDTSKNQTTFTNVLEVGSAVDSSLLSRMEALIEANKTYVGSIQSTNGIVFKNNSGTTDLTAVVRIGTEDVTNNFNIIWYKDGVQIATTPTITVTATDVVERALYKFEAKDSEGVVKAFYEVTVSDVSDGDDGRGISSTKVEYQSSTSGTEVPKGAWVTNPPTVSAGQYLWTRTTFTYTDSSTTLSYSISRMGADGEGVGIADVTITYQAGTSGTTPPTGEWTSSIPSVAANQFLWTRTVTTYTDGETSTAYSVGKMGANGADAQLLYLSASSNVMSFDSDDIVVPDQTVTITANLQNASGTVIWKAIPYIGSSAQNPITLTGTGNTRTLSSGLWTNPQWTLIAITATVGSLTDTVSVVKVADGKAVYLHTAWLMPDGTFIKDYPNENELPNSKSPKFSAYSGSSMTYTENVSVPEWGATDAVQHKVSGGTYETISGLLAAGSLIDLNTKYVHSMYIKNVGTTVVRISNNLSETLEIAPNETKRLVFAPASKDSGRAAKQFTLYRLNSTDVQEFIVWHAKIEKSDSTATVWTPMPSEDPVNAYPRYEGTYSDNNVEGSDTPSDYEPWKQIKGEDGKDIFIHRAWKMANGTFTPNYPADNMLSNSQLTSTEGWGFGGGLTYELKEGGEILLIKTANTGSRTFFSQNIPLASLKRNTKYSIYIEVFVESATGANVGNTEVFLRTVANGPYIDSPKVPIDLSKTNQWQVLQVTGTSYDGVLTASQFTLAISQDVVARIRVRKPKLAEGTTAFPYTPKPSEDPVNAYPKYAGEYSDHNETASSNPDDYEPWQVIRGEEGAAGQDAKEVFSGYLTNEAVVLPANASGAVTDFSKATGSFVTFLGQTQLTSGVTYAMESSSGITATINQTTGDYAITAMTASVELGTAIFKATYDGISIKKQVIVTKAKQGGAGVGLISTAVTYQAGASGTTPPTGTWVASVPTVPAGQFLWTRTIWTFSDNTTKTGYSIGKVGETGATGNGIASSAITYAASTSGTSAPTSGWQATIPTVAAGSFLWTRTILTYTNGSTNTSYAVAKQGEKGDPTGIVVQSTVPTADQRYVGMLWRNTGASGYIKDATYRWNGSAFELYVFIAENISVDNLAAITGRIGEIYNDYSRTYNDNTTAIGTLAIKNAEISNTGKIRNSSGVITQSYESIYSHQLIAMSRYEGSEAGDQNKLLASAGLTFDTLSLMNKDTGFSGTLTAEMLYDTGWINLPLLKGSGQIRVRKFMKRYLIQFADYAWNGTGPNQPADAIAVLPPANNPGRDQLFNVKVWSIDPQRVDAFQLNKDGRLYKLSNNSQTLYYRNTVEVFD